MPALTLPYATLLLFLVGLGAADLRLKRFMLARLVIGALVLTLLADAYVSAVFTDVLPVLNMPALTFLEYLVGLSVVDLQFSGTRWARYVITALFIALIGGGIADLFSAGVLPNLSMSAFRLFLILIALSIASIYLKRFIWVPYAIGALQIILIGAGAIGWLG
jgi:hypothetical protein